MTYEYACQACSAHWDVEQSIKDPAIKRCPTCGADAAKRLVSGGTGFLLKGGGWYADGYGSAKSSKSGETTASDSSSTASSDKSKPSDAKPTEKAATPAPSAGSAGSSD
jgi:putative FmdB family regulatory protein